jgi:hypothetical protein
MDQVRVHFYRHDFIGAFEQRLSERSLAWSDFDNQRHTLAASGPCNVLQNGFSEKEVLA